jgi:hypothetical protein
VEAWRTCFGVATEPRNLGLPWPNATGRLNIVAAPYTAQSLFFCFFHGGYGWCSGMGLEYELAHLVCTPAPPNIVCTWCQCCWHVTAPWTTDTLFTRMALEWHTNGTRMAHANVDYLGRGWAEYQTSASASTEAHSFSHRCNTRSLCCNSALKRLT